MRIFKSKKSLNGHAIWHATIDKEMVTHLSPKQISEFCNELSDACNDIGAKYKVGREYKNGKLKKGWWY